MAPLFETIKSAVPPCRTEHAALAQNFLEWHTHRVTLERTLCQALRTPALGLTALAPTRYSHLWGQAGPGAEDCTAWGASFALRSATAALSAMRSQAHVATLRDQIAITLLATPSNGALSPRARRLIDSPVLTQLLKRCLKDGRAQLAKGRGGEASAGSVRRKVGAAKKGHTPLARVLSGQRLHLTNQPPATGPPSRRQSKGSGGLGDAALTPATRLLLPSGARMPMIGLGTNYADCCCGGREWLGTDLLVGGVTRPRLSPGRSVACTSLPAASFYTKALAQGVRMMETGASYATEIAVGEGMRNSGISRDQIFLISKAWPIERLRSLLSLSSIGPNAVALKPRLASMHLSSLDVYLSASSDEDR